MFENVVGVKINQAKINRENFLPIWTPNEHFISQKLIDLKVLRIEDSVSSVILWQTDVVSVTRWPIFCAHLLS